MRHRTYRLLYCTFMLLVLMIGATLSGLAVHASGDSVADYITFKYDSFEPGDERLLLNRDTIVNGNTIRLTPAATSKGGSIFNKEKVSLKDDRSFSTYFTFEISGSIAWNGGPRGGDGIVFTVQTHSNTASSSGGTLGYFQIDKSIGIKFDTWQNDEHGDPSDNSIAILQNGNIEDLLTSEAIDKTTLDLMTGTIHAWIDYNGPEGKIEVRLNKGSSTRPVPANLSYTLGADKRLTDILNSDNAYVGFTAATGGSYQNHDITSWYFSNKYDPIDIDNKTYKQAPSGYDIHSEDTVDGNTKLTITALGENTSNVTFAVYGTNAVTLTPTITTTDVDGQAIVIASSPDGNPLTSTITVEGPGGIYSTVDITISGRTVAPLLANIMANATSKEVAVKGVPEGAAVRIYDHNNVKIGEKTNVTGGQVLFEELSVLSSENQIGVTFQLSPQTESERTSVTPKVSSVALDAADIDANVTTDKVIIKNVPEDATIIVYDESGNELGRETNTGPGAKDVVIEDLGLEAGKDIQVTITEDGKLESEPTVITVVAPPDISTPPSSSDVLDIDVDNESITIGNVPPGATVIIYDQDGNEIGRGTNNGVTTGEVTITDVPLETPVIGISIKENGKDESDRITIDIETKTQEVVDEATRALEIGYQPGDTWESVTLPLFVVSVGLHNTAVQWTSSKPEVVEITLPVGHTIEARVHRQEKDESVILTAKVTKNGVEKERTFLVIVKAVGMNKTIDPNHRQVNVTGGEDGQVSKSIDIDRISLTNGPKIAKIDKVIFDANDFVSEPNTKDGVSSIYIDDYPGDAADEIAVEIPEASIDLLFKNGNSLEIRTDNGTLSIDHSVLGNMVDSFLDLFFRLVPVRDAAIQMSINNNVLNDPLVIAEAGNRTKAVLGSSLEIETNYTGYNTTLLIPFAKNGIHVPTGDAPAFRDSLYIFIEHSDGTKAVVQGTVVNDGGGTPIGLSIAINKFSTFSIIQLQDRPTDGTSGGSSTAAQAPLDVQESEQVKSAVISSNQQAIVLELDRDDYNIVPTGFDVKINNESLKIKDVITSGNLVTIHLNTRLPAGSQIIVSYASKAESTDHAVLSIVDLALVNPGYHAPYISGFTDGTFRPDQAIIRAEIAALLARNMTLSEEYTFQQLYPDVLESHWASAHIEQLKEIGWLVGDTQGKFRPSDHMTRAEIATIAAKWLQTGTSIPATHPFTDVSDNHWASGAIAAVYEAGVISGFTDGTFGADKPVTRAQAVIIMNQLLGRSQLTAVIKPTWLDVPSGHWAFEHIEEASQEHFYMYEPGGKEELLELK